MAKDVGKMAGELKDVPKEFQVKQAFHLSFFSFVVTCSSSSIAVPTTPAGYINSFSMTEIEMGTPTLATGPPTPVLHRRLVGERALLVHSLAGHPSPNLNMLVK